MALRTVAVQVSEELFARFKAAVAKKGCRQKDFLIALIERAVEEIEAEFGEEKASAMPGQGAAAETPPTEPDKTEVGEADEPMETESGGTETGETDEPKEVESGDMPEEESGEPDEPADSEEPGEPDESAGSEEPDETEDGEPAPGGTARE